MGNYMETCLRKEQQTEEEKAQQQQVELEQDSGKTGSIYGIENGRMRVKLVLTKDELGWLLLQLKNKQGKRLEDVLGEIGKSRLTGRSTGGWKPSLDSIMENPEVHHEMNRS